METKIVYRDGDLYWAEDHGANTFGVFFKSKRMKKGRYIATAGSIESIQRHIWRHKMEQKHGPMPAPKGPVNIHSISKLADEYYRDLESKENL